MLLLIDKDRRVRKANRVALTSMNLDMGEVSGMRCGEVLHCINAVTDPRGCEFSPVCATCLIRQLVVDTLASGQEVDLVEASVAREVEGRQEEAIFLVSTTRLIMQGKTQVLVALLDITKRKRAEKALRDNEERYRMLFEDAQDGIALADAETGLLLDCNSELCRMVERERIELLGQPQSILHPAQHLIEGFSPSFLAQTKHDTGQILEEQLLSKTGKLTPVEIRAAKIEIGGRNCLFGIFRDITERKRVEEQVRSQARFPEENPNPVLRATTEGSLIYANPAAQPLLDSWGIGYGESLPEEWWKIVLDAYNTDQALMVDMTDNNCIWTVAISHVPEESYVNLYLQDVTQTRMLEAQLRQQQKLESIGTLASGIAHEINNPINGIMNLAQLIEDAMAPADPARDYTQRIVRETERIATIVRNLLAFARQERQSHSPARMADIVEATLTLTSAVLRHDQIQLTIDVPEDLPLIKCRSQQIQQVLLNLVGNARDALNSRYPEYDDDKKLLISSSLLERDGRRWLHTAVEDHGCGIPEEIAARLFDPFFTTKPKELGTGLGLSISHGIVKDHHGTLTFESEPGQTRFFLDIPIDNGWERTSV